MKRMTERGSNRNRNSRSPFVFAIEMRKNEVLKLPAKSQLPTANFKEFRFKSLPNHDQYQTTKKSDR